MSGKIRLLPFIVAGLVFVVLPQFVNVYTDWLWFGETGYQDVFLLSLSSQLSVGFIVFGFSALLLFGNLQIALKSLKKPHLLIGPTTEDVRPMVLEQSQLRLIIKAVSGVVALFLAFFASSQWLVWLKSSHAVPFGKTDPILGQDVAFYVFQLPALELIRTLVLLLIVVSLIGSAVLYFLSENLNIEPDKGLSIHPIAKRHLSLLGAAFFLLMAFGAYLDMHRLLLSPGGVIHGASYTDVHAELPALRVLIGASILAAVLAVAQAFSTVKWLLLSGGVGYIVVSLAGSAYSVAIQRLLVAPNEQVRETPFMVHNIEATRDAFGIDGVEERELSGDDALTGDDIEKNSETIANVRLWDHQPLLDTFGQIQEIRTYYDFASVDNDRYVIDGNYRQIMLSARELNSESLPNRSWINERLVFTHGYGLALGPVNEVTQEGLPVLFVKNIPPQSSVDLEISEPSLYFGEMSNDHVFVNTRAEEFHYPEGDDNVYSRYEGSGGISVGSFFRKLLFSLRFKSFKLLLSDDITQESRVLFHRNLSDRLSMIAPFLTYDEDPYLVVSEGKLFWIRDAYTVTDRYPYSSPVGRGPNYIRNSVKVVVDAYNGSTTYYLADPDDPLAKNLDLIFPNLFRPLSELSDDLKLHLRYPEGIFSLQAEVLSTYHMTNPDVFYNKEDQWDVPSIDDNGGGGVPMQPYYTIMRLPGEENAEFIQMLPFTPRRKDNLAAWLVARSDGEHYGKLRVFQFPKQKVVFGPRQIVARINQDQAISPQITLWNQQGSQVIWGTLLVIPIEESLLYIRPLYLRAAGGRIPELKRVIVAHQNQIVMEETLDQALTRLFGSVQTQPRSSSLRSISVDAESVLEDTDNLPMLMTDSALLARKAREHYEAAMSAQRVGDWAGYGEELRQLGMLLEELNKSQ